MSSQPPRSRAGNPQRAFQPTTLADWGRSDEYHNSFLMHPDEGLEAALASNAEHGLPDIAVSKAQGKYMKLLVQSLGAKKILEVGTLGGYSTIWMARGLPKEGGEIITLEIEPEHAKVATENFKNAGVSDKIKCIVGPAAETLKTLEPNPPFDFAFIDADKASLKIYFTEAKRLIKSGGVIILDNVVRGGQVADPEASNPNIDGVRVLLAALKDDTEVDVVTLGLAGEKGYDGYMYAVKK